MLRLIFQGLLAGALIVCVAELARRSLRLGAILMFVPIAIPVLFLIMYLRGSDTTHISRLSRQALLLIPLSLPMFIPLALAQQLGLSFWTGLGCGIALAAIAIAAYLCFGPGML